MAGCGSAAIAVAAPVHPMAGLAPYQRPATAPIQKADPPPDRQRALRGIPAPIPGSLDFLAQQGGWFTPFIHPGMTGPYDLRGWHTPQFRPENP